MIAACCRDLFDGIIYPGRCLVMLEKDGLDLMFGVGVQAGFNILRVDGFAPGISDQVDDCAVFFHRYLYNGYQNYR